MFRQSPSRNQRSKGFKVKQVLQICLLLAVCFWLIYQVKHSHDKKKEFDQNNAKASVESRSGDEVLKFGRKDLHPREEEVATITKNEKHGEEEEEEETGGEDENKHEEEKEEEENKTEEREDEGRGGGDDEIDEQDQETSEVETDREEDFIDEEKEREEEDNEKESEEKESEEKEGETENESYSEDQDHDGGGRNTHEAREEQYKGDDASSAVTHDTQTISTETDKVGLENSNENADVNILEQENKINNHEEINVDSVGEGEMAGNGTSFNATASKENDNEIILSKSEDSSLLNSTITTESNDQPKVSNNSTEVSTETPGSSLQNGTETSLVSTQAQNVTVEGTSAGEGSNLQTIVLEQTNNSNTVSDNNPSDSDSTVSPKTENVDAAAGESSNSISNSESAVSEKMIRSNETAEAEDGSGLLTTKENSDAIQNEKSDTSNETNGTDENLSFSSTNENADAVRHDPIDSSIPQEEKDARTDLDTLPDIRTEGSNSEDAVAE